jgi:hypothetical protein
MSPIWREISVERPENDHDLVVEGADPTRVDVAEAPRPDGTHDQ